VIALKAAALAALAALFPRAQDPAAKPTEEPAAPAALPPPVLQFTQPLDHSGYEAALGRIAEAFPDLLRVRSLGKSRGGRDLWLVVLSDSGQEEPRKQPAALLVTDLLDRADGEVAGPEAALFVLESLLVRAREDPAFRERLRGEALYFLPAPDPDHAFATPPAPAGSTAGGRACSLQENFPARWLPFGPDVRAPGPYALSEPESLTLARFLLERENLSTLVLLSRGDARPPASGTDGEEAARAPAPGSLRAFARETLDLALIEAHPWTGAARSTPIGDAPAGFETAAALAIGALDALPRLECSPPKLERLRPDLWILDLPVRNKGALPTLGQASRRPGMPGVSMRVTGGRVVACALREGSGTGYAALHEGPGVVPIGDLDGLEAQEVRLVVQAEEGAELSVSFSSPRAGTAVLAATLR